MTPVDINAQWREVWTSAPVVNQSLVPDPTIQQPGFDYHGTLGLCWTAFGQVVGTCGTCHADLHQWGLFTSESCSCRQKQTMSHIVDSCPLSWFEGSLQQLHTADDCAVHWLETAAKKALAKWKYWFISSCVFSAVLSCAAVLLVLFLLYILYIVVCFLLRGEEYSVLVVLALIATTSTINWLISENTGFLAYYMSVHSNVSSLIIHACNVFLHCISDVCYCLLCFDTVGWAPGRPSSLKKWVMMCWCGYLSGTRCTLFAYGPADATAS